MRKGADVLSKWVGEAERQLRLLFEEAQKAQPSIIFFDEIDGLAPVSGIAQSFAHDSPHHYPCMPWRAAAPVLCCSSAVQADADCGLSCRLFDWEKAPLW